MELVKVKKEELLGILRKNCESHRAVFEKAQIGYRKEAIRILDKALKDAKEGRKITMFFRLDAPVNQTDDYIRAIKMIEMSVDENIEISEDDFKNYVLDKWHWRQQCDTTNAYYVNRA